MPQQNLRYTFEPAWNGSTEDTNQHIEFEVVEFTLQESLSEPYILDIELESFDSAIDFAKVIDQPICFTIWQDDALVRRVHGLVSDFSQGNTGFRRTRYHAVVEPQLARLNLSSDWRIFQQKTIPEIIGEVFKAEHLHNFEIQDYHEHLQREYCVQADETDLDYTQRLAAEEGFVYRFEHSKDAHRLILSDVIQAFGVIPAQSSATPQSNPDEDEQQVQVATILYQPNPAGDRPQPALRTFTYHETVRTSLQTQRDYTFRNPRYSQQHSSHSKNKPIQASYERYDYPGRYKTDATGRPFTQTRIESLRRDTQYAQVNGDDARIEPGLAFELTGHPRADMNIMWRAITVTHSGIQHTSSQEEAASAQTSTRYEQTAQLIPATFEWKAPIPLKPRITGAQIARVVGPASEEIYCDEWGRIKVQFPWDRQGQENENSSCWIRVAQGWGIGAGDGQMSIPRIGQEVIVEYLDQDPDQPIVIGRTNDALNPPPYELPKHKTRSTWRSQTHKGQGFNEIRFEDENQQEEIYVHAQRNKHVHVEHDNGELVEHDEQYSILNDQKFNVGNDRTKQIGQDEMLTINRDRKEHIGQDVFVTIGRNEDRKILSNQREEITANHILEIGENETITIEGVQSIEAKTCLKLLTKDYILQGQDRILIRGPNGKIIFDASGITIETPALNIRAGVMMTGPATDQVETIKAAIQQGTPFVEECPGKVS